MSDNKRFCMGCMKVLDEQAIICPHCHYSAGMTNKPVYIKQGETIADRYLIGKALASSNDSVIYIGLDKATEKVITVYEFFPAKIAARDSFGGVTLSDRTHAPLFDSCLQSFLGLWRGIKMFDDVKCIPHVTDIIRDNGTAYAIAEHKDTVALKDYFAKTRKPLATNKAVAAFLPLLNALKLLHNAGIIHGNITPSTVQVGADGRLNLIGFSIPQCRSDIPELAAKPVSGFSPLEIYQGGAVRAQSDIYSVMAVMYYCITGIVLPRATERLDNSRLSIPTAVAQTMPPSLIDAFSRSLAVQPSDRLNKTDELVNLIKSAKSPSAAAAKASAQTVKAAPAPKAVPSQQAAPASKPVHSQSYNAPSYGNEATVAFTPPEKTTGATPESTAAQVPAYTREAPYLPKRKPMNSQPEVIDNSYDDEDSDNTAARQNDIPLPILGALTCVAVIIICFILFVVSYATFLYKNLEVPVLDDMLSSITFLPMNRDNASDEPTVYNPDNNNGNNSDDPQYVTVPDFKKFTEDHIRGNETFQNNFEFVYKQEASETVEKNGIISQSIAPGESVLTGTRITLTVSTGQPEIIVPDVYGKTYEEAAKELRKAGFTVKKEIVENTDGRIGNTVQTLSIEPGKGAAKGTEIVVFVWDEPVEETTTEPTTTEPTTTEPTTTEPTTTEPTTTQPTTTEPTTTEPEVTTAESVGE